MSLTPQVQARLQQLRYIAANERALTLEEQREAISLIRADRLSAGNATTAKRTAAAKAAIPDADDMLADMMK